MEIPSADTPKLPDRFGRHVNPCSGVDVPQDIEQHPEPDTRGENMKRAFEPGSRSVNLCHAKVTGG